MPLEALKNSFAGRALGAGLAGLTALTPLTATAQDAAPAAMDRECTQSVELCELQAARLGAHEYAETHSNGVGIVFHIGEDIQAFAEQNAKEYNVTMREVLDRVVVPHYQAQLQSMFEPHGLDVQIFARVNENAVGSGFNFYIGETFFETLDGKSDIPLPSMNEQVVAAVAESLEIDRRIQAASRQQVDASDAILVATPPG